MSRYEYDFLRINFSSILNSPKKAESEYRKIIKQRAKDGWRLVQIFSPATSHHGHAEFYEMIFERPVEDSDA